METPTIGSVEMASSHSPGRYCPSCGSRLARDNTDTLCALCRKKASEALRHSPTVPPEFWELTNSKPHLPVPIWARSFTPTATIPFMEQARCHKNWSAAGPV
jgi:predicted amidophosphoribosyltransferase